MDRAASEGHRVLACAPYGQDGATIVRLLNERGYEAHACTSVAGVAASMDETVGVVIVTEEALVGDVSALRDVLAAQPPWSDMPFVLLAARQSGRAEASLRLRDRLLELVGNVVVLERPLGVTSLLAATVSAMRARQRQFQMRDRMADLAAATDVLESQVAARTADLQDALARLKAETAERERAEASLRQSQKMEAVGQLTGGIAHDFNNMLTGVIGSLDLMRRRIAAGRFEDLDRYMDAASSSATRAASLTQRLLAFSRRQSLDAKAVDVNAVIASMGELLERAVDERVSLAFDCADDLPRAMIDPNQLENAILNLVINGRDAMPGGGVITIRTFLTRVDADETGKAGGPAPGCYVAVSVADAGVGMSTDILDKVFDPFFTTKPIGQGTGLGLSMVYGFAQQSGGQVKVESAPGEGATVTLWLPTTEEWASAGSEARAESPGRLGEGQHVLVVEDDDSVRMLVREVLEELRYRPVEFSDPLAAMPFLASDAHIDLMISDVGLPGMNGRELAETARTHRPDLPILFITGYAENATIRSDFLGPNMAMITKPFSLDVLAARIGEMVRQG